MRILVVDDHPESAELLDAVLSRDGHVVLTASSFQDALRIAEDHRFDLLIADLRLSDGSGWDLLRDLKQTHPSLPAIAVSGLAYAADLARSREAGFCEHLSKPVNLDEVRLAVRRCQSTPG